MPISDAKILIVNADDFGHDRDATDLTMECFAAGRLSSATAMVHMEDSERSAALAREGGLPTGLHLNFTEPFSSGRVPGEAKERQAQICRALGARLRFRSWSFDPRIARLVEDGIRDQLEQFEELFGGPPTHVDGHEHVQVCPNVTRAASLRVTKLRNALWSWPSERSAMAAARAARRFLTARRFITTRYFLDISQLGLVDGTAHAALRVGLSRSASVEVMCHPAFDHELEALRSPAWTTVLSELPLGSYRDLS